MRTLFGSYNLKARLDQTNFRPRSIGRPLSAGTPRIDHPLLLLEKQSAL
jgi:hypothetical protein